MAWSTHAHTAGLPGVLRALGLVTALVAAVVAVPASPAAAAPKARSGLAQPAGVTPALAPMPAGTITPVAAGIQNPTAITAGPDGNLWFTNQTGNAIGQITPAGVVHIFGDPSISRPWGITAGPDGNLWFVNAGTNSIGRITTAGVVSSFTDASIQAPRDIASGSDGALWFTNSAGNSIGRITTNGAVSSFSDPSIDAPVGITAGPGSAMWFTNSAGDSIGRITTAGVVSTFTDVNIAGSTAITAGPDGNLWFTNTNSIGELTPAGVVSTYFADVFGPSGITAGPDGALWYTNVNNDSIGRITTAGVSSMFTDPTIVHPGGIAAGPDGALWFTDGLPSHTIGRITTAGMVSNYAGSGLREPDGITTGPDGNLWVANFGAGQGSIERITPAGVTATFTDPALASPTGITTGPDGALWFTDLNAPLIGRITTAGVITTFAGPDIVDPDGIVSADGALWFTDGDLGIGRITTAGVVTTFTGPGFNGAAGIAAAPDGDIWFTNEGTGGPHNGYSVGKLTPAGQFTIYYSSWVHEPQGIAYGPDGNMWFANQNSGTIGRVTPDGQTSGFYSGEINEPTAITAGPDGNLWFSNGSPFSFAPPNIGRISTGGVITIFPGDGMAEPEGITAGPDGNVWFADSGLWSVSKVATTADGYHAVAPARILDSRPGPGNVGGYTTPWTNSSRDVTVAGLGGVPADADAVVLNVTVTNPTAASYLSVWPAGLSAAPFSSSLNFSAGETIANQVTVQLGRDPGDQGKVTIYNFTGSVDVIADVTGYYQSASGEGFTSVTPARLVDSRPGAGNVGPFATPWGAGTTRDVAVTSHAGVPADADGVVLNVTATGGTTGSYLSVWPQGSARPTVSSLNWVAGQTIPNAVTVELPADGELSIYNYTGSVDVVIDVSGYFEPGTGKLFHPLGPARVLDSRPEGTGPYVTPWGPTTTRSVPVVGDSGALPGADSVVANVTVTDGDAGSFLTVWPAGTSRPTSSSLNWVAGETIPNAITVKLSAGGQVSIYNYAGDVDVVMDVAGWYG